MQGTHHHRARTFARLSFAGAVASLLAAILLPAQHASAAAGGTLSMNPPNLSMTVGGADQFVTLDITGGTNVHEVHLGISYDPAVLQVVDSDQTTPATTEILPGSFPGDATTGTVLLNTVSSGIINYQYALNGVNVVNGAGTVATVQFHAIANGNANIAWVTKQFYDGSNALTTVNGSVAVVVVGANAPTATSTPTVAATSTPAATNTPTATRTPTLTPVLGTATATSRATATAAVTVISNSNSPGLPPASGAAGAAGLPHAGNDGPGTQWWKWTFFLAALMLAGAGWFFTFALHAGNREVVLTDRRDMRHKRLKR